MSLSNEDSQQDGIVVHNKSVYMRRVVPIAVAIAVGAGGAWLWWPMYSIDSEMDRLCKADGGVHVYESVALPADEFDKFGMPNFVLSQRGIKPEDALGPAYVWKRVHSNLRNIGNVTLEVSNQQVVRRSDNKLLGESYLYYSFGGWQIGEGARKTCPDLSAGNSPDLVKAIFVQRNQ